MYLDGFDPRYVSYEGTKSVIDRQFRLAKIIIISDGWRLESACIALCQVVVLAITKDR